MKRIENRQAAQVADAWWDEFVTTGAKTLSGPEMASTIRVVHRVGGVPEMDARFAEELGQRLDGLARRSSGHYRGGFGLPRPSVPTWSSPALLILAVVAIVGGFFGMNAPGQLGEDSGPKQLAAPMSTPNSTPQMQGEDPETTSSDPGRTGQEPGPAPVGMPELAWRIDTGASSVFQTEVSGDQVFASMYDEAEDIWLLRSYALADAAPGWVFTFAAPQDFRPHFVVAGTQLFLRLEYRLLALDIDTGIISWEASSKKPSLNRRAVTVANGGVYISNDRDSLTKLDVEDGSMLWEREIVTNGELTTPTAGDGIIVVRDTIGSTYALDEANGTIRWTFVSTGFVWSEIIISEGRVIITTSSSTNLTDNRSVAIVDARTGDRLQADLVIPAPSISTLAVRGNVLVTTSNSTNGSLVVAVDLSTRKVLWTWESAGWNEKPMIADDQVYVWSGRVGTLSGLNVTDGSIHWQVYLGQANATEIANGMAIGGGGRSIIAAKGNPAEPYDGSTPDLSGLPPCSPPRSMPAEHLLGEPTFWLAPHSEDRDLATEESGGTAAGSPIMRWWTIKSSEIPTNPAPAPEVAEAIQETLRGMNACKARPEAINQQQGFFSDDFYRRDIVIFEAGMYRLDWTLGPDEAQIASFAPIQLEDGRIAARFDTNQEWDVLIVFVEQDGHWLIDEVLAIQP